MCNCKSQNVDLPSVRVGIDSWFKSNVMGSSSFSLILVNIHKLKKYITFEAPEH